MEKMGKNPTTAPSFEENSEIHDPTDPKSSGCAKECLEVGKEHLMERHNSHLLLVPVLPCFPWQPKSRECEPCLFSTLQRWSSGAAPTKFWIHEEQKGLEKEEFPVFERKGNVVGAGDQWIWDGAKGLGVITAGGTGKTFIQSWSWPGEFQIFTLEIYFREGLEPGLWICIAKIPTAEVLRAGIRGQSLWSYLV